MANPSRVGCVRRDGLGGRLYGEISEVTCILRQLQTIRAGTIQIKSPGLQILKKITNVPAALNAQLSKLKLLHLFGAPPAWADTADSIQPQPDKKTLRQYSSASPVEMKGSQDGMGLSYF
jgi:hypothetical protein